MAYAIKAEICELRTTSFAFTAQKTMYGGKHIAEGDTVFVFASENDGGRGLIARGVVTSAQAVAKTRSIGRQTPRVRLTIRRTAVAKRPLGRSALKHLTEWNDGQPGTELNFKFYRQATNKIVGISDEAAAFLDLPQLNTAKEPEREKGQKREGEEDGETTSDRHPYVSSGAGEL